jgi:hypothetical protein
MPDGHTRDQNTYLDGEICLGMEAARQVVGCIHGYTDWHKNDDWWQPCAASSAAT